MRPVPNAPRNRSPNSRISSQVARALTAKCRSKLSTVVSSSPESTDSQWHMTSAVTSPRACSAASKICAGAVVVARSASIATDAAPCWSSDCAIAAVAPASGPQAIRLS